ncbi:MAG: zinc ABC transporter substrate-binding protein [Planctomycetes bacterium]|nr:zinc ABC transporter substrate-binding protein [Planctomycetota bacterium]
MKIHMHKLIRGISLLVGLAVIDGAAPRLAAEEAEPLRLCATVPDLGSLARSIAGAAAEVTVFANGAEDAHYVQAKPSFIKALSRADLFIQSGLELETGWAPPLLNNARNPRILPGAAGFLDASKAIAPLEIPTGPVDRSMGDVHPLGNPHYLTDPVNGLKVARLIRDKLTELMPDKKAEFDSRFKSFQEELVAALAGEKLVKKYDAAKLALLIEREQLEEFLKKQKEEALLGGWLGAVGPFSGVKAVADHNLWPYFARRFGIQMAGFMEPKPGIPPSTRHLQELIKKMQIEKVALIYAVSYYNPRHAQFVSEQTGAKVLELAHQVGSRSGADDYLEMVDHNVKVIVAALGAKP